MAAPVAAHNQCLQFLHTLFPLGFAKTSKRMHVKYNYYSIINQTDASSMWGEPDNPKYELHNRNVLYCAVNRT